jgi:hypothetical protein
MNTIAKSMLVLAVGGLISVGSAMAQNGADPTKFDPDPGHPRVNEVDKREVHQQNRIARGVENGSLTAGEARHLEKNEARIDHQKQRDMAANGGHLTKAEQNQINRDQDAQSRAIRRDKHNDRRR